MAALKPDDVKIIQIIIHDAGVEHFVILGLGSDSNMYVYVYDRNVGWENFRSVAV